MGENENLAEVYRIIAEALGLKAARMMSMLFKGTQVYFPDIDRGGIEQRNEVIKAEYDGYNTRALALKYGLSERWIKEICEAAEEDENKQKSDVKQISIFDESLGSKFLKTSKDTSRTDEVSLDYE